MRLLGEVGPVADIIFIETRDDGVAVVGNHLVEALLLRSQPVFLFLDSGSICAHLIAEIEVAVA